MDQALSPQTSENSIDSFKASDWIGVGRKYPTENVPDCLSAAKRRLLTVPTLCLERFPKPTATVFELLAFQLPEQSSNLSTFSATSWFSKSPPNVNIAVLFQRPIPSAEQLRRLENSFGQAWLDGNISVVDIRVNEGRDRFSPWVIMYWKEMERVLRAQSMWQESWKWFRGQVEKAQGGNGASVTSEVEGELKVSTSEHLEEVERVFQHLPWNREIVGLGSEVKTLEFSTLLGTEWLTDNHIDMMVQILREDLSHHDSHGGMTLGGTSSSSDTIIETLSFSRAILQVERSMAQTDQRRKKTWLYGLEQQIKERSTKKLYFPLHVNGNHWIVGMIDFIEGTLSYADSLVKASCAQPQPFNKKLMIWLQHGWGKLFNPSKPKFVSIPHTKQNDSYSCGIITANTIQHNIFGYSLWTSKSASFERIKWFLRLVQCLKHVANAELPSTTPPKPSNRMSISSILNTSSSTGTLDSELPQPSLPSLPTPNPTLIRPTIHSFFGKRPRSDTTVSESTKPVEKRPKPEESVTSKSNHDSVGLSKSAVNSKALREKVKEGTHKQTEDSVQSWKEKILKLDEAAKFRWDESHHRWESQCGRCGSWVRPKEPGTVARFREHRSTKKCLKTFDVSTLPKLSSLWTRKACTNVDEDYTLAVDHKDSIRPPPAPTVSKLPCPGITADNHNRVTILLTRTGEKGGAPARHKIAIDLYGKTYAELKDSQKRAVLTKMDGLKTWELQPKFNRVKSTRCTNTTLVIDGKPRFCLECSAVFNSKAFKVALQKTGPKTEHSYRHVPHEFRNPVMGQLFAKYEGLQGIFDAVGEPCIQVAKAFIDGKLKDQGVFTGVMAAMATQIDRENRGIGKQNFQYTPEYYELCQIIRDASPQAYEMLSKHFPMPDQRSLKAKRAREPRFPLGITPQTFELVTEQLEQLGYHGHVALSCDDTKLLAALRLYYDKKDDCHYLIGGTTGSVRVANPEQVLSAIEASKVEKATKIRLWCLTLPSPKIMPILVAAVPIGDNMTVDDLFPLLRTVLDGLIDSGIRVVSYASDGSEVERGVQKRLLDLGTNTIYTIPNPHPERPDTHAKFTIYRGQAICIVQDSKHALKTCRNNLFSGARFLIFGNYNATYKRIRRIFEESGPIRKRDVEKIDRQDDNAATRLFSAATLQHLVDRHKDDSLGEIMFLFIFGELIDAFQNRSMKHSERLQLGLRARYFLDAWSAYLNVCNYQKTRYHISREGRDILDILIESLISLVIIHRDYVDGLTPLLPWLNSTEPCEHVFGCARQFVKDFTYADFIYMVPKLRLKIREAVLNSRTSDSKASAAGYAHTYFDDANIDFSTLSHFPSDSDITVIAKAAAEEADSLILVLGINPTQLFIAHSLTDAKRKTFNPTALPSISSWYTEPAVNLDESTSAF